MRIEYENTFIDVLLFNMAHQFRSPVMQGFILLLTAFVAWSSDIYQAIASYIVIWLFQFIFNCAFLYSRKNQTVITRHIIELQEDALLEETRFNRSYFFWDGGVHKIAVRANRVAIYISPFMAHIIPPSAFSSHEQKLQFIEQIRSKLKSPN